MACARELQSWPPFRLNNDSNMPAVGLGTFKIRKEADVLRAVDEALAAGYRLFDTAAVYRNEMHLKKAFELFLPKYELEREDIFIVSKLSPNEMFSKKVVKDAYEQSCKNLGLDYLDLFLIHFPGVPKIEPSNPKHKMFRNNAWSTLTALYDDGLVNAIGVSNFTVSHLKDLINNNHHVMPTVNQVEWHPYFHDEELFKFCHMNDIVIQGYSPFGGLNSKGVVLQNPVVKAIAEDLSVTPAQILLVWSLQSDVATIPKSKDPARIRSNFELNFKLNDVQMKIIDKLHSGKKFAWDSYPII